MAELRSIEEKWQRRWYEEGIFNAEPKPNMPKFFITVAYPYVSGAPHIGHGRTFTIGDVLARYKRAKGYNVLYPIAWHITGTPIQSVADRIAKGDPEDLKLYEWYVSLYVEDKDEVRRILDSFRDPWNIAKFFASMYEVDFKRMGFSMDFRRKFTTGDPEYNAFIIWQYERFREGGYVVQGSHAVLYSPDEGQAVGEHDIRGGDVINVEIVEFNLVKFRLGNQYLVAATLRPETIYGVTNLWVNPRGSYVVAQVDGEEWIISSTAAWKLRYQDHEVKIMGELRGKDLVGRLVRVPLVNREVPILPGDFVDEETATGVVYSVPAHAPYDYVALMEIKRNREVAEKYGISSLVRDLEPISIIKVQGYGKYPAKDAVERLGITGLGDRDKLDEATRIIYREEFYGGYMRENTPLQGMSVREARERTIELLREAGAWGRMYEVEPRRVYTRSGNRVIVAIIRDQWFLNYSDAKWKERAIEHLKAMRIVPEKYRKSIEDTINWLTMRPCARKRGLGTRLPWDPDWVIEALSDSTIYMAIYTIMHRLKSRLGEKLRDYVMRIYGTKGSSESLSAVVDLFNFIFLGQGDAARLSAIYGVAPEELIKMREEFLYWYPVDVRHSGIDLVTNHLTFFIMHHVAIFPREHWPRAITLNDYVIREGARMSRSLGNVLPLPEVYRRYSADLFRLHTLFSADLDTTLDWREDDVANTASRLQRFWVLVNEIIKKPKPREVEPSLITRWLLSRINRAIVEAESSLESMSTRNYVLRAFFDLLGTYERYLEVSSAVGISDEEVAWASWYLLERWVKLIQPVMPHIAEEIWHRMGNNTFVSLEAWPQADSSMINEELEVGFEVVERTLEDIREVLSTTRIKPSKVYLYVGPQDAFYEMVKEVSVMVDQGKPIGDIIRTLASQGRYRELSDKVPSIVNKYIDGTIPRRVPSREIELSIFRELEKYLSRRINATVHVQDATKPSYDPSNRARNSLPGRPAIYIE